MTTLIRIPTEHMCFASANKQSDDYAANLSPAKWPIKFVLISNAAGRDVYLDRSQIHAILAPAIQDTCRMTPEQTNFFPTVQTPATEARPPSRSYPTRPLPRCPATTALAFAMVLATPPKRSPNYPPARHPTSLGTFRPYHLPRRPLRIVELCGGLVTGLEALFKA